jgi:hypothetical protein
LFKKLMLAGAFLSFIILSGCASIVNGQNQSVSVDTPGCSPANCELTNDKGKWFVTTPGTVTVRRAFGNMEVACSKAGFATVSSSVASSTKAMAFGNILFGGVIGAGVDMGTGAAYDYPPVISVPLACGPEAKVVSPATATPEPKIISSTAPTPVK